MYRFRDLDNRWAIARRVTEVIRDGLAAPELEAWKRRSCVEHAIEGGFVDPGDALASWETSSRIAADRGTAVHQEIAAVLRDPALVSGPTATPYVRAWYTWQLTKGVKLEPRWIEQTVTDGTMRVAGAADCFMATRRGRVSVIDWKTVGRLDAKTRAPWPSHLVQAAAYASMIWRITDTRIVGSLPVVDEARIVRLYSDGDFRETVLEGEELDFWKVAWSHVRWLGTFPAQATKRFG